MSLDHLRIVVPTVLPLLPSRTVVGIIGAEFPFRLLQEDVLFVVCRTVVIGAVVSGAVAVQWPALFVLLDGGLLLLHDDLDVPGAPLTLEVLVEYGQDPETNKRCNLKIEMCSLREKGLYSHSNSRILK